MNATARLSSLSESDNVYLRGFRSVVLEADRSIVALRSDSDFVVWTGLHVLGCLPLEFPTVIILFPSDGKKKVSVHHTNLKVFVRYAQSALSHARCGQNCTVE